jgi:acetyltransferase-like isoleucine patch superfamily enzyme
MHSLPPEFSPGRLLPESALRQHLKFCGKGVRIYEGVRLVPPDQISIGDFSQIDEGVLIFAGQGVEIGRHVHFAISSSITGGGSCIVHDFAGIGAGTRIVTGTELLEGGLSNPTIPAHLRVVSRGRVEIHTHALLFTNSVVLPGVTIGEGAVVSAGSLVHRDLKPWSIYGGNPLVQIGVRSRDSVLGKAAQLSSTDSVD